MARNDTAREEEAETTTHGRRTFMKLVGATAASAAAANALSGSAKAASNYETIKVPSGKTHRVNLGDNDTLENVLIDVTASGASVAIRANGDGWAIRNVGIKGQIDVERPRKIFAPSVPEGGSAVVENFYMGDGADPSSPSRIGGVWVNANTPHEGELTFRNFHIAGFADNGLYGSGPAKQNGSSAGSVKIENSYGHNNNIASFRIGGEGSYVKDSTIVVDGDVPAVAMPGKKNARGIWCKDYGTHVIENCDIVIEHSVGTHAVRASHGAVANIKNSRISGGSLSGDVNKQNVSSNASKQPPKGVPMTAEEAASGTSSAGGTPTEENEQTSDLPNTISIAGHSSDTQTDYTLTVDGTIEHSTARNASINPEDSIDKTTATGFVRGGVDSYGFKGQITNLELGEGADVFVNGEQVDPATLGDGLSNTLSISGNTLEKNNYSFEVDGELAHGTLGEATVNPEDKIDGSAASGFTRKGTDSYRFSGKVTSFEITGDADVFLNGEQVDPAKLGTSTQEPELPNVIVLDGTDSPDDTSSYTFGVSGEIRKSNELGSTNPDDIIENGVATGTIADGKDAYRFSGELTEFQLEGTASVNVQQGGN